MIGSRLFIESIYVRGVRVCLFEATFSTLEQLLSQTDAVFRLAGVLLNTVDEVIVFRRTLLFDNKHARCMIILAGESNILLNVLNTLVLQKGASLSGSRKHI